MAMEEALVFKLPQAFKRHLMPETYVIKPHFSTILFSKDLRNIPRFSGTFVTNIYVLNLSYQISYVQMSPAAAYSSLN